MLQVSTIFPLLSAALMRDRDVLGEMTYGALLEMALLVDERESPWSEQVDIINIVEIMNSRATPTCRTTNEEEELGCGSSLNDEVGGNFWCRQQVQGARNGVDTGLLIDDRHIIRNVLPLALILKHLPHMASSVQVRLPFIVIHDVRRPD